MSASPATRSRQPGCGEHRPHQEELTVLALYNILLGQRLARSGLDLTPSIDVDTDRRAAGGLELRVLDLRPAV